MSNLQNLIMLVQHKTTNKYYRVITNCTTLQSTVISQHNNVATVHLNTVTKYYNIVELQVEQVTPVDQTQFQDF